jgi:predicted RNA polymerase sigma factor
VAVTATDTHRAIEAVWRIESARLIGALGGSLGNYALQAAIAACHARAATAPDTDWERIALLYDALAEQVPSPVVELNRAVAHAMARGPAEGLALVDRLLGEPSLATYHLLPSVRGDLLFKLGRKDEARGEFERAAMLARRTFARARARGGSPTVRP